MRHTLIGLAAAFGLTALAPFGVTHADTGPGGPFRWCPGESMQYSPEAAFRGEDNGPGAGYSWDMNICHTWYRLRDGGNVPYQGSLHQTSVWDGDNPPPGKVLGPLPKCDPSPLPCL
jgi:hypothetical protein